MMQMTVQIVVVIISVTAKFACSFTIRRDVWLLIVSIPFVSNHSLPIGQDSRTLGHKSWLERDSQLHSWLEIKIFGFKLKEIQFSLYDIVSVT